MGAGAQTTVRRVRFALRRGITRLGGSRVGGQSDHASICELRFPSTALACCTGSSLLPLSPSLLTMTTALTALLGDKLIKAGKSVVPTSDALAGKKAVGLYFSAHVSYYTKP